MGKLVLVIGLLIAQTAVADVATAREAYERGLVSYNLQHFEDALELFGRAYEEMHDPAFLFNIGQCHRQLGHFAAAARSYRAYLNMSPSEPANAEQARRLIAEMERAGEAKNSPPAPPPAAAVAVPPPSAAAQSTVAMRAAAAPAEAPPARSAAAWALLGVGLAVTGAGAGLLGYGIAVGGDANHASTVAQRERDLDHSSAGIISGSIVLGFGVAAVVSGVVAFAVASSRYNHRRNHGR